MQNLEIATKMQQSNPFPGGQLHIGAIQKEYTMTNEFRRVTGRL
jgi:hypothetical protein